LLSTLWSSEAEEEEEDAPTGGAEAALEEEEEEDAVRIRLWLEPPCAVLPPACG